jgi:hypothetical protein
VSNGFTETFGASDDAIILYHAGTIGSGTVTMPASPLDGQVVHISLAMTVTNLTVSANAGQTLLGSPTTGGVSTPCAFVYRAANTTWYRRV